MGIFALTNTKKPNEQKLLINESNFRAAKKNLIIKIIHKNENRTLHYLQSGSLIQFNINYFTILMQKIGDQISAESNQGVQKQEMIKNQNLKAQPASLTNSNSENVCPNIKSTNIFSNFKKPEPINLFGGNKKSINLFEIKSSAQSVLLNGRYQTGYSIFNIEQKPIVELLGLNDSDSEKSGDQSGQTKEFSQNISKSEPNVKVMKYEYKNEFTQIFKMPMKKFKNGMQLAKEEIFITLEKLPTQPNTLYLIVRNNGTNVLVYQGTMLKNLCKLEHFMEKSDNLKFIVLKKNKNLSEEGKKHKITKEIVKLRFFTVQLCEKFQQTVEEYFNQKSI